MSGLDHRPGSYALLHGGGLEIGALHQPAELPEGCSVEYADVATREQLGALFPELDTSTMVPVQHVVDLDRRGLDRLPAGSRDFVIMNHVIEHLANPIAALEQLFRLLRPGGLAIISAPDKEYTFDKPRALTPFEHLLEEYRAGVTEVSDEHYLDFLHGVHPEVFDKGDDYLQGVLASVRGRREHVHVWNSESFRDFLHQALEQLGVHADCRYEVMAEPGRGEYFSVWRKQPLSFWRKLLGKLG